MICASPSRYTDEAVAAGTAPEPPAPKDKYTCFGRPCDVSAVHLLSHQQPAFNMNEAICPFRTTMLVRCPADTTMLVCCPADCLTHTTLLVFTQLLSHSHHYACALSHSRNFCLTHTTMLVHCPTHGTSVSLTPLCLCTVPLTELLSHSHHYACALSHSRNFCLTHTTMLVHCPTHATSVSLTPLCLCTVPLTQLLSHSHHYACALSHSRNFCLTHTTMLVHCPTHCLTHTTLLVCCPAHATSVPLTPLCLCAVPSLAHTRRRRKATSSRCPSMASK
jgi:hypothetical protein